MRQAFRVAGRARLLAGGVVLAAGAVLVAQQSRQTFRSGTDVVRLEVTVLDKDRRPVRGLTFRDFTVLENGRERPIVAFTPVELPAESPGAPAAWLRDAPRDVASNVGAEEGRLVVIAFDWSIRSMDQAAARRIAQAAVDHLGPTDEAAIIFTNRASSAGMPQNFTADRARLRATIDHPFAVAPTENVPPSNKLDNPEGFEIGDCLCRTCSLEVLTKVAGTLRDVSRRPKVVLFITSYYRSTDPGTPMKIPPVRAGQMWQKFTEMPGACTVPLRNARQNLEAAMGEANATVHVFDAVGQETFVNAPLGGARIVERQDALPVLADMTGGRAVMNTNAPESEVGSILAETSAYYVLGFTPATGGRSPETRRVSVRVRGHPLTVRARDRFTTSEDVASTVASPDGTLMRSIGGAVPAPDVPLEVSAVPVIATGDRRSAVVVVARLRNSALLALPPAAAGGGVTMLTAAFTPRGAAVGSKRRTLQLPLAGSDASGAQGLIAGLPIDPGSYEVRVATELSSGRMGSVHAFVDVPDFARDRLTMSGLLVSVDPPEPAAPRDEIDNMLPLTPTARRDFRQAETVSAFVQVSQGTARDDEIQSVALRVRIVNDRNAAVRDQALTLTSPEFSSNRTATSRLSVPVQNLPPGDYLLTLDASMGERKVTRTLRFRVS